jgi:hypothetical protein
VRPAGLQAWNSSLLANDFAVDFGDAAEMLRPVEIVGVRNGSFSGKVVVGCDRALDDFRVTISDLKGPGTIPAAAVRLRFAVPWSEEGEDVGGYTVDPVLFGALEESPPTEVPVRATQRTWRSAKLPSSPPPVFGAVVPVWVTVDVPKGASAGTYTGTLTVDVAHPLAPTKERPSGVAALSDVAQPPSGGAASSLAQAGAPVPHQPQHSQAGAPVLHIPVRLTVEDWTLPDTQDFRTWVELIESPDTLALEYGLTPWSDKHFEMIAQAMRHAGRAGSRVLYVPVICRTNLGNDESMVRWIRKPSRSAQGFEAQPDGSWDWDFSVMDRYLDTAARSMGRPKIVCFWVWETFMFPGTGDAKTWEEYRPGQRPARLADVPQEYIGRGPKVTVLDSVAGKTHAEFLPHILAPESKEIWRPLFAALRKRMEARGWTDAMMLGTPSDVVLRKEHFALYNEIAPGVPWVNHSHFDLSRTYDAGGAKLGYYSTVIDVLFPGYPEDGRHYGWKSPVLHAHLRSRWGRDFFPLTIWRHVAEVNIAGDQRGVARLGADFWKSVKDKGGRRIGRAFDRFPEAGWRSNDLCSSLLAPGKDGPVATVRYEMTREGVQECEARIFIERALTDDALKTRLGSDLATRAQDALDERVRFMIKGMSNLNIDGYIAGPAGNSLNSWWNTVTADGNKWFLGSGWEARTQKLFRLAGEVERKLAATRTAPGK